GVILPWKTRHKGWVRASNNWGQVCHGGLTAGALAVLEDEPDLAAKTVHNALMNVPRSMHAFAPNGSYPEGPGYWAYGTSYNVVLIAELESALGSDFGLTKAPGFSLTGQYPAVATGPSGLTFNYADGGSSRGPQSCLFWFADRFDRPDWLLGERERVVRAARNVSARDAASGRDRLLPLALLWMTGSHAEPEVAMPLHWSSGSSTPITIHRGSWTDPNTTFVGLKGGSPSANHGQMDTGSFVLDAAGVRWALDLGAEGYHGIESRGMSLWSRAQSSDRWTIFRQMNQGHNTLVIDGQPQRVAGNAPIVQFSDAAAFPHSIVDLTPVYRDQVKTARRGVALLDGRNVLIQDELTGLKPGSVVRWGMITPGSVDAAGKPSLTLSQGDARLTVTILAPADVTWTEIDTAKPRKPWDSPNRGTRMIAFQAVAPASGDLTLAVFARPRHKQETPTPEIRPLRQWGKE
ncbi:heparinase II/III family protein, partial [bacterium]|nr:heparinase II/III family protein [bacterium]